MKILVTGATGFIGKKLIPILLQQGHTISVLTRNKEKAVSCFGDNVYTIEGDILDPHSLKGCCEGIDIVYQLVGLSGGNEPSTEEQFDKFRRVNVQGLKNIADEALRSGVKRFIQVSSIAAMGGAKDIPISAENDCRPTTPYQVSKYEGEMFLNELYDKFSFPMIIVRPTWVYGPGGEGSYDKYIKILKTGFFPQLGKLNPLVSYCYVDDLITTLSLLVDKGKLGQTYICSTEKSIHFQDIIKLLAEGVNIKHFIFVPIPKWLINIPVSLVEKFYWSAGRISPVTKKNINAITRDRVYDLSKNQRDIGFVSSVSMEEGVARVVKQYKERTK